MKGPKGLTEAERRLHGTRKKSIKTKKGSETDPKMWPAPKWLGKHGREVWNTQGPVLMKIEVLTDLDKQSFLALCSAYDDMITAREIIEKEGWTVTDKRGAMKKNPMVSVLGKSQTIYKQLAEEFGLVPVSRNRLGITDKIKKMTKPKSDLDDFMARKMGTMANLID